MRSKVNLTIRNIVIAEVARGRTINVDAYCQVFLPMCRGLERHEFENIILQAVADAGGTALWGSHGPAQGNEVSGDAVVSVARAGLVVVDEPPPDSRPAGGTPGHGAS